MQLQVFILIRSDYIPLGGFYAHENENLYRPEG